MNASPAAGSSNIAPVSYRVEIAEPGAHLLRVSLEVPRPPDELVVSLPVWIPGSYMVREFARHLSHLEATQAGTRRDVEQLDKATWRVRCEGQGTVVLTYRVYAFDPSVRAAYLDQRRGFWNGTSVCLRVHGREGAPHRLQVTDVPRSWQVATALAPASGRHAFEAGDYDELVDQPVMLGTFWRGSFDVRGVTHDFCVDGALPSFDGTRLAADTKAIVETQMSFWHGPRRKPPFGRYVFMLNAVDDGHGGLEHRASTALIASRRDLPRLGAADLSDGYVGVLGLVSHEYFHTWSVKRLTPRELASIDYRRENHTELLWFFEGFTSYYDDLLLVRSGRIDAARYVKLLAKSLNGLAATPGRFVQSVAQSSFDAWTKYYRPDENTPNATVSYYTKGALVGLALDLTLRSEGRGTLDDVMRVLWNGSGGGPIDEGDIARALHDVSGRSYEREIAAWVHGTDDLPLPSLLDRFGVSCGAEPPSAAQRFGLRVGESAWTGVQVKSVLRGGERLATASPRRRARDTAGGRRADRAAGVARPACLHHPRRHRYLGTRRGDARPRPVAAPRGDGVAPGMAGRLNEPEGGRRGDVAPAARARRIAGWSGVVGAVVLLHLLFTERVADRLIDLRRALAVPPRLQAAFVREIKPAPPPEPPPTVTAAVPPPPPPPKPVRRRPPKPKAPAEAASAPDTAVALAAADAASAPRPPVDASSPVVPDLPVAADLDLATPPAAAASAPASAPAALASVASATSGASGTASAAPAGADWPAQWPASTRLSYTITGWYRGEVHGEAVVEWLRDGSHYQMHLDVSIGPSLAPLMTRRMSSDGQLTASGLRPDRYDEETRVAFSQPRRSTLRFEPEGVVMPDGRRRERWPGVQDAASQFVHLVWLFTTQPQRLQPGSSVEIPLALPRNIDRWVYDVQAAEELKLPFGTLPVVHLKPRRVTRPGGDLVVETWFAPTLLYLPVRIRIHQDEQTWLDLLIDRPPLQAQR